MDTLLTAVAAVSLAVAAGMGLMLATAVREERRRSEARILALTEMSAEPVVSAPIASPRHRAVGTSASWGADVAIRPAGPKAGGVPDLFAERERSSPWGPRLAVIGAMVAILLAGGILVASRPHGGTMGAGAVAAAATQPAPLELLSLRYQQQNEHMEITGLVKNPAGGAPLARVTATAFLFGGDGTFLASGRALLDYTTLAPGEESPFVITVPISGTVTRYRVGFRGEDGRVLAHVDRRAVGSLATRDAR
jgi:hypothetical protein